MSETLHPHKDSAAILDPERPWITDPDDLPSKQKWASDMFNPFGRTSKLHFSRVWTFCFISCFLVAIIPPVTFTMATMIGIEIVASLWRGWATAFGLCYTLTLIISFIAHIRRLSDAEKSPLWAVLVLVPAILASSAFIIAIMQADQVFERAVEKQIEEIEGKAIVTGANKQDMATAEILDINLKSYLELEGEDKTNAMIKGRFDVGMRFAGIVAGNVWALLSLILLIWQVTWMLRLPAGRALS